MVEKLLHILLIYILIWINFVDWYFLALSWLPPYELARLSLRSMSICSRFLSISLLLNLLLIWHACTGQGGLILRVDVDLSPFIGYARLHWIARAKLIFVRNSAEAILLSHYILRGYHIWCLSIDLISFDHTYVLLLLNTRWCCFSVQFDFNFLSHRLIFYLLSLQRRINNWFRWLILNFFTIIDQHALSKFRIIADKFLPLELHLWWIGHILNRVLY